MILEHHEISSALSRTQVWDGLVDLATLDAWSAVGSCVSTGSGSLEPAHSYVCVLHHGDLELDASMVITEFEHPEVLGLRTTSAMAVVHERLALEPDGRGSRLHYSASATSSMFGPAVTVWLHDHVSLVHSKLRTFLGHS